MIRTTAEQRAAVRKKLTPTIDWRSEKIWTYLVADILDRAPDQRPYLAILGGSGIKDTARLDPWFEAQPMAPRKGTPKVDNESNTQVDLAIGAIRKRGTSGSGIEFDTPAEHSWVCFVEGKGIARDCDFMTVYDPLRNQLERDIESLLYFQTPGHFPAQLCFTVLSPRRFKMHPRSRLYGYRMTEYLDKPELILKDIERCKIPKREEASHEYPILAERLNVLTLRWVAYEDILEPFFGVTGIDILDPAQIPGLVEQFQRIAADLSDDAEHVAHLPP